MHEIKVKLQSEYYKRVSGFRSRLLNKNDFTIISNNCWGGRTYAAYKLPYNSPTVGMFIMPDEYIKLIYNLRHYLSQDLTFINPHESSYYGYLSSYPKFGVFPIGKLDDIEIVFLHYSSEEEAYTKWNRRSGRINWNRLIIKFCDQNRCQYEHLRSFDELQHPNKICFSAQAYPELESLTYLKSAKGQICVRIEDELYVRSKHFNFAKMINEMK